MTVGVLAASARFGHVEAHKPIASKYTYSGEIKAVLDAHCTSCHYPGGVAPMSLIDYPSAVPWAESIKQELLAGHMPPWRGNPSFTGLTGPRGLSARELDMLMTWVSGGTPEGSGVAGGETPSHLPWPLGTPDEVLPLGAAGISGDDQETVVTAEVPMPGAGVRWLRGIDLRPGTPALVRGALMGILPAGSATGPGLPPVVFMWLPGKHGGATWPVDVGLRVPARSRVLVRLWYRKTWQYEGRALEDTSQVGLYWHATTPSRALRQLQVSSPSGVVGQWRARLTAPDTFALLALTALPAASTQVALRVGEAGEPLHGLLDQHVEPRWPRRWTFERPSPVRAGDTIEVRGTDLARDRATEPPPALVPGLAGTRLLLDIAEPHPRATERR